MQGMRQQMRQQISGPENTPMRNWERYISEYSARGREEFWDEEETEKTQKREVEAKGMRKVVGGSEKIHREKEGEGRVDLPRNKRDG